MPTMNLTYEEFDVTPDISACLELEVEYTMQPYEPGYFNPITGDGNSPCGGVVDEFTIKVVSAKMFDSEGLEWEATPEKLAEIQTMATEKLNDWVETQINENHEDPEHDYD